MKSACHKIHKKNQEGDSISYDIFCGWNGKSWVQDSGMEEIICPHCTRYLNLSSLVKFWENPPIKQMESNMSSVEFMMRVKLPESSSFHSSPSGDTEYEIAYREAIFDSLPEGFEVVWPRTNEKWPIDSTGLTWVRLRYDGKTDQRAILLHELSALKKQIHDLREHYKALGCLFQG